MNEGEGETEVARCGKCNKAFLPVNYFEKVRARAIKQGTVSPDIPELPLNPLNGLLVFW